MNANPSIGQSISRCKNEINSILSKWEETLGSNHFDLFRGMAENLNKEFGKEINEFIEKASERAKNGHKSSVCMLKIEQNEQVADKVITIDSDDDLEIKAEPEVESDLNNVSTAIDHTSNRSIVDVNPNKTAPQNGIERQRSSEIVSSALCQSGPSASRTRIKSKYQCEVCSVILRRRSLLLYHRGIHLNDVPVHCRICLRSLDNKAERTVHEKYCNEKRFECYLCGKALFLSHLRRHMRIHSGERPFKCKICGLRFNRKSPLYRHQVAKHFRKSIKELLKQNN